MRQRLMEAAGGRHWLGLSIHKKLMLILALVALLPAAIFSIFAYRQLTHVLIHEHMGRMESQVQLVARELYQRFEEAATQMQEWAALPAMQHVWDPDYADQVQALLADYRHTHHLLTDLWIVSPGGDIVANEPERASRILAQVGGRGAIESALTQPGRAWVLPATQAQPAQLVISASVQATATGRSAALLMATADLGQWFHQSSYQSATSASSRLAYSVLLDASGRVLEAPAFVPLDASADYFSWGRQPQLLAEILGGGGQQVSDSSGDWAVSAHKLTLPSWAEGEAWFVVQVQGEQLILGAIDHVRMQSLLLAVTILLMLVLGAWAVARQVTGPIGRLTRWAESMSQGELEHGISLRSHDELASMAESLESMRQAVKRQLGAAADARQRYCDIIDSMEGVVWEASIDPPELTLLSGKVEQILGYSIAEARTLLPRWREAVKAEQHGLVMQTMLRIISEARDGTVEIEFRHKNGHWVWLRLMASLIVTQGAPGLPALPRRVVGLRGVIIDIDKVVRAAEKMAQVRDIAIKTAHDKSHFLDVVSHEIRTPINGLLGMLDLASDYTMHSAQRELLTMARESGTGLLTLVDDVMDFGRMERGDFTIKLETVNISELLQSVLRFVAVQAYRKGLDVGLVVEADMPEFVQVDGGKLRRVLLALLDNAIKFTEQGMVMIWTEMLPDNRLFVEVRDSGLGIPVAQQASLFDPFARGDSSSTRRYGGAGLGLTLSRQLIQCLNGDISVRSIERVGSSFMVELPVTVTACNVQRVDWQQALGRQRRQAALLAGDLPATHLALKMACKQWGVDLHWEPKEDALTHHLEDLLQSGHFGWLFVAQGFSDQFWEVLNPLLAQEADLRVIQIRMPTQRYGQRPLPYLYPPFTRAQLAQVMLLDGKVQNRDDQEASTVSATRALVVDDNEVNRRVACGYLRKLGFECDIAEDGRQAVSAIKRNPAGYGLVLMDCQMPVMDGYQATAAIRELLHGAPLPVIAVTANAMEGDREKCLACGMDDYLAKPLRKDTLAKTLNNWLPQHFQRQAHESEGASQQSRRR